MWTRAKIKSRLVGVVEVGCLSVVSIMGAWINWAWAGNPAPGPEPVLALHPVADPGLAPREKEHTRAEPDPARPKHADRSNGARERSDRDRSVFLYGARWTDNRWVHIMQGRTEFEGSYLGTVGITQTLRRFSEDLLLEAEVNVTRHWGEQDHFELNAALNLRWSRFPWDRWVDTSFAYGLGPSYAFTQPPIEARPDQPASRGLVFMVTELTFESPRSAGRWAGLLRIHHRSGAFDLVSEASGSNFIATGLRYRF